MCAILNGVVGVVVMAAPPLISSTWFPTSERTTATAINQVDYLSLLCPSQASNAFGIGISMLFGPALIHYKPDNGTNLTQRFTAVDSIGPTSLSSTQTEGQVRGSIDIYLEILAGVSCLLFLLFLLYFPSKPPH